MSLLDNNITSSPRQIISGLWYSTIVVPLMATACLTVVMWKDVSPSAAFTWHPILMCFSFLVFMSLGMNQYWVRNQLLTQQELAKSRQYHAAIQIVALVCAIGGWIAIFMAHSKGKGHTAKGDPFLKMIHTWFGYLVLVGVSMQSVVGMFKFKSLPRTFAKWHGALYAGPLIWLGGCFNIILATFFWKSGSYNRGVQTLAFISVVWTVSVTLFFKVYVMKTKYNDGGHSDVITTDTRLV